MQATLCSAHQGRAKAPRGCDICSRLAMERRIVTRTAREFLRAGYAISVHDGDAVTLRNARRLPPILKACFTSDDDRFYVARPVKHPHGPNKGWVQFIYGNCGWDVVSDYTTNVEHVMDIVNLYVDEAEAPN